MTRNPQKTRMKNIKKTKKTDGKHGVFDKFFFVHIGVGTRVQNSKKCGWCRGCQTVKKTDCFVDFAVLCGSADSSSVAPNTTATAAELMTPPVGMLRICHTMDPTITNETDVKLNDARARPGVENESHPRPHD